MRILFTLGLHSHSTALLSIMLIHLKYLIMLNYFKYGAFQYSWHRHQQGLLRIRVMAWPDIRHDEGGLGAGARGGLPIL